jgi:hypothetical protein
MDGGLVIAAVARRPDHLAQVSDEPESGACAGGSPNAIQTERFAALQIILGGFPDTMRVEIDKNIGASAKTVGELRKWRRGRGISQLPPRMPCILRAIKVGNASGRKCVSTKP